ncbi:MAG: 5-(carboxyamino)imidazole ribonucleotide synthase [Saprospiraceae bacterium]|jgi:5-(carboxyamino)imidazole ribonucleotide synthase
MGNFNNRVKIAVVGGGQLGRMLQQKAYSYGLDLAFLDPDRHAPSSNLSSWFYKGSLQDEELVYDLGKNRDIITIEIENVNTKALKRLEKEGKKVFPQPHIIELIQDKGLQKQFFIDNNIPTSTFYLLDGKHELPLFKDELPFMQKMRKGGYDGKGVVAIKSEADFDKGFEVPSILEKFIDFKKELSVIVARNESGEVKCFPCVEQEFSEEANLVEFLFSPAIISPEIEKRAIEIAENIISKLEMVGILAVELFLTQDDELLVNEIAPRPHNSGHQTIEGNTESQYGQLLRCLLNMPLGDTSIVKPSVMVNLLGEKGFEGSVIYEGMDEILSLKGVYVHLYGKKITKPFRKMGHITITADTIEEAKEIAIKVKNTIKVKA